MAEFATHPSGWPVVIRSELRDPLVAQLSRRPSRAQLLRGPSGIGKTTLAAQVARELSRSGLRVLPVVALEELRDVPLAALAPLLNTADAQRAGDEVPARIQALVGVVGRDADRFVLLVDDAPLLDALSASVVYQLVRVYGVAALLTARDEHALDGPLARLLHEDLVTVTDLIPLNSEQVIELVEQRLAGAVRPETAARLVAESAGNPLVLRELVLSAERAGGVHAGPFGLEVERGEVPEQLRGALRARLSGLDDVLLRAARLVALAQPAPNELAPEAIAALRESGIVEDAGEGRARLAHPLFAEVILAELEGAERHELAQTAAAALRATGLDSDRLTAVIVESDHLARTDDLAADELEWAAAYVAAAGDPDTSLRLAEAARQAGGGFRSALLVAAAQSTRGAVDDADRAFEAATRLADDPTELALAALRWGQHLAYRRHDPAAAVARADDLLGRIGAGADAALRAELVKWRLMAGQASGVADSPLAPDPADVIGRLSTGVTAAMLATMRGDSAAARAEIEATRPLAELARLDQPQVPELLELSALLSELADGRIAAARHIADERRLHGSADAAGQWSYVLALIELHGGRIDTARQLAELATRQLTWRDVTGLLGAASALEVTTRAVLGESTATRDYLDGLSLADHADIKVVLQATEAQAWVLAAAGEAHTAAVRLELAAWTAIAHEHELLAALSASTAIALGEAAAVEEVLVEASTRSPAIFVRLVADAAIASARSDHAAALALVPRLRDAGLLLVARRLVDDALASPQLSAAVRGQARRAAEELPAIPVVAGEPADPFALSARELDIARRAAARERSKEIAVALGISERTVNNHLASVYRKLGVSGRDELPEALAAR